MFRTNTFRTLSRKLSFILIGSIALSSVGNLYPQEWFKKAYRSTKGAVAGTVGNLSSAASQKIKGGLSSAYDKVRHLGPAAIVSQLQKQVENLGNKVGYMGNCMIKGSCSQAERAAFIGTSIAVLALTVAVVGVTLSVAATSKEVESVTKVTSQEVQGWGPQQIFQRLGNTIRDFKQSLASLKQGILKKQLTRGQKKFLYGTAISIAALVTFAVGVGIASYVYAEKKQKERQAQAAAEPVGEQPSIPATSVPLEQLAQPVPIGDVEAAQGPFGKLFDRVVQVKKMGKNLLQQSAEKVKKKLELKTELGRQALQATGQKRNQLIQQAEKAYNEALIQANQIKAQIKKQGHAFIKEALSEVFDIDYDAIKQARETFDESLANISPRFAAIWTIPTWRDIERVQTKWYTIQNMGHTLWQNLTSFLSQLATRTGKRAPTSAELDQYTSQERKTFKERYPLAYKFDFIFGLYRELLALIVRANIPAAGTAVQQLLYTTGTTLQTLADMHSNAGTWGKILITSNMIEPLNAIGDHLKRIGLHLKKFTEGGPLAEITQQLPEGLESGAISKWLGSIIRQPMSVSQVKEITNALLPQMLQVKTALLDSLQKAQQLSDTFTRHSSNLLPLIEQNMKQALSQTPFQNYLNVAKQSVLKEAKISKDLLNDLLLHITSVINYIEKLITSFITTIEKVNDALGKKFISHANLTTLKEVASEFAGIRSKLASLRQAAKEEIPV